jgi:hypothetical protein
MTMTRETIVMMKANNSEPFIGLSEGRRMPGTIVRQILLRECHRDHGTSIRRLPSLDEFCRAEMLLKLDVHVAGGVVDADANTVNKSDSLVLPRNEKWRTLVWQTKYRRRHPDKGDGCLGEEHRRDRAQRKLLCLVKTECVTFHSSIQY